MESEDMARDHADEASAQTKVCPQCGQVLFADMGVCYGCLYDFTRVRGDPPGMPVVDLGLDEEAPVAYAAGGVVERWQSHATSDQGCLGLLVQSGDMDVVVPLGQDGLLVGRMPTNDIVLHSRAVSGCHVRIVPDGEGVLVEDCGATNPVVFKGREVHGSRHLVSGDVVNVCGTLLTVVVRGEGGA